jgi:hypothetical protein
MSKRKARIMFFKAVSVGTLVLLGVWCVYLPVIQISRGNATAKREI